MDEGALSIWNRWLGQFLGVWDPSIWLLRICLEGL